MARAHVTEELIQVVKVQHKKHPAFTQKELAENIGCSAATVGRILAGKYDTNCKRTDKAELYSGSEKKRIPKPCKDKDAKTLAKVMENQQKTSTASLSDILGSTLKSLRAMFGTDEEVEEEKVEPIDKDHYRKKIMTEIQTLRETSVDIYKELKQLKGILGEIRNELKEKSS